MPCIKSSVRKYIFFYHSSTKQCVSLMLTKHYDNFVSSENEVIAKSISVFLKSSINFLN